MTRNEIVAEAARRLGDESTAFLTQVDKAFDFVLADLAAHECLEPLRDVANVATLVAEQRDYDTLDLIGGSDGDPYPYEVLTLRVWGFGSDSLLDRLTDDAFEQMRARDGEELVGRPRYWRPYPDMATIQLHPPADDESEGEPIEVLYVSAPAAVASGDEVTQVQPEDIETIVFGLKARLAQFLDETVADAQGDWQLYLAGRQRMWGRRHNNRVGTIQPSE